MIHFQSMLQYNNKNKNKQSLPIPKLLEKYLSEKKKISDGVLAVVVVVVMIIVKMFFLGKEI